MEPPVRILPSAYELAESLAIEMVRIIEDQCLKGGSASVCLSGGSTPNILFGVLGDHFSSSVPWSRVHIFWVDERCVPPDDIQSNFGSAREGLLSKISIPEINIHRIHGEEVPEVESLRYEGILNDFTESRNGVPCFDVLILGLGEDGHTASIFPGQERLFRSVRFCEPSVRPGTGQQRITLTGRVINNSRNIFFLVSGKGKAGIVKEVIKPGVAEKQFPASYVFPSDGNLTWFIDREAASLI